MGLSSCSIHGSLLSMLKTGSPTLKFHLPACSFYTKSLILRDYNFHYSLSRSVKHKPISPRRNILNQHTVLLTKAELQPLDLTEDNVTQVLSEARSEFFQLFDPAVGITGVVELVEIDGPYVKLRLKGRFWHKRSTVLARLGAYLQKRIPEILEVDIEDEAQLDDSPENF